VTPKTTDPSTKNTKNKAQNPTTAAAASSHVYRVHNAIAKYAHKHTHTHTSIHTHTTNTRFTLQQQ